MDNKELICKKCGKPTTNEMKLVTVKTMVDRGFRKNNYYQAMGDLLTESVCNDCVEDYIKQESHPTKKVSLIITICLLVIILGLALTIFIPIGAVKVLGLILIAFSIMTCIQEVTKIYKKISEMDTRKKNHHFMEYELITKLLPKKHVDAELTYIEQNRIMKEDLTHLGKEYGVSIKKLQSIRQFIKDQPKL